MLAEVAVANPSSSTFTHPMGRVRELKQQRQYILSTIVGAFPAPDEDNVTCVDLWLKCAFWSNILSKMQQLLVFNVGGKRVALKQVFSAALLDAVAAKGGVADLFSLWLGALATACLQPKVVREVGVWALHKALHTPIILDCIPSKYAFLRNCFSRMKSLRGVGAVTQQLKENGSPNKTEEGGEVLGVEWQLLILHTFSVVCAVQLNDLQLSERSGVKEKQLQPMVDMFHRWVILYAACHCVPSPLLCQ